MKVRRQWVLEGNEGKDEVTSQEALRKSTGLDVKGLLNFSSLYQALTTVASAEIPK